MKDIHIRPAVSSDIPALVSLEHNYSTDHVWQMAVHPSTADQLSVSFREVRLPRPMRVIYPRDPGRLIDEWTYSSALLVAEIDGSVQAYLSAMSGPAPRTAWVTDLVVGLAQRRQGVATALLGAARRWALEAGFAHIALEMQSKNYPGVCLAKKLGFVISGYHDRYYPDGDIALFFELKLR